MAQATDPSTGEMIRAWITLHSAVDRLLQLAAGLLLILVALIALAGSVYWVWFLARLFNPANLATFLRKPIPALRRVKTPGGLEAELASSLQEGLPKFDAGTTQALDTLTDRVAVLEKSVQRVETEMEHFEDVSGRLPRSGG